MRVGVISDIHGNCVALDAALADLKRREIDDVVCLGDAIQGGTQPRQVIERLGELGCPVIMGNADSWVVTGKVAEGSSESTSEPMEAVRKWTLDQIGNEGVEFINGFLPTFELKLEGANSLLCFHGSPASYDEVILPDSSLEEIEQSLGPHTATLMTGGHTHIQWTARLPSRMYFNPGSVGLAYNRYLSRETFYVYPLAQYAVVVSQDDQLALEFCTVPFDVDELERAARASGAPYSEGQAARFRPPKSSDTPNAS